MRGALWRAQGYNGVTEVMYQARMGISLSKRQQMLSWIPIHLPSVNRKGDKHVVNMPLSHLFLEGVAGMKNECIFTEKNVSVWTINILLCTVFNWILVEKDVQIIAFCFHVCFTLSQPFYNRVLCNEKHILEYLKLVAFKPSGGRSPIWTVILSAWSTAYIVSLWSCV